MAQNSNQNQNVEINKIAAAAVTMTGRVPTDIVWRFTPADVKKDILLIVNPVFGNLTVDDIGLYLTENGDRVGAMVKIPKDSRHIQDKSSKDLIINKPVYNYSGELKELMDRFCPKNAKKLIPDADNRYFDIPLDLERIYTVVIDKSGEYAKNMLKNEQPLKCNLQISVLRDRNDPKRIKMLEVTKSTKSLSRKEPRPTKNFNW